MRIGRRRLGVALAGLLLIAVVVVGVLAALRWRAAGAVHAITPPAGAVARSPDEPGYERAVLDRAGLIGRGLRSDRGAATVRVYAWPPGSPWLRARTVVATQLDHWEQIGDCADRPEARIVECAWKEPTRWWPREVRLTLLRPRAGSDDVFLIIGSGRGD